MSTNVELLWIIGVIAIAILLWFNAAKTEQRGREARERELEAKEHEHAVMLRFDELNRLLAKPGTTLEDVKTRVAELTTTNFEWKPSEIDVIIRRGSPDDAP